MILIGISTLQAPIGTGRFYCPQCQREETYELKATRLWFLLYFIPLIPLGRVRRHVECQCCGFRFSEDVLEYDPAAEVAEVNTAIRRAIVLAMMEAERTAQGNVAVLCRLCRRRFGHEAMEQDVYEDLDIARRTGATLSSLAKSRLDLLEEPVKVAVMEIAVDVLACGGFLDDDDRRVLRHLGNVLMLPPSRVDNLLA